jgi:hypothetical protein
MKLIISTAVLTVCLFAPIANAKCDANSKTIFSCETKQNKQIELCDLGKKFSIHLESQIKNLI